MQFKGEMSMLNVLRLQGLDVNTICSELEQKRDEAPQFFMQSPIIVDCAELTESNSNKDKIIHDFDFVSLKQGLLDLGFIPVGVRNVPISLNKMLVESGWAIMRAKQSSGTTKSEPDTENAVQPAVESEQQLGQRKETTQENSSPENPVSQISAKTVTVERPVRSGQQVYAADANMTVLAPTSAGSEIMADGSIHIYGALRGRVLAGARGNESARIYCQSLQAELIAIAGRYQLLDESDTNLKGKPAMIRLEGEKLVIEALT